MEGVEIPPSQCYNEIKKPSAYKVKSRMVIIVDMDYSEKSVKTLQPR